MGISAVAEKKIWFRFTSIRRSTRWPGMTSRCACGTMAPKCLETIKSGGLAGSFRRGEWEHETKGDVPNLRKARDTALAPLLTKKLKRRLKPVFETHIHRTSVPVRKNGTLIEVALDEGQVRAGQRSAPISELELELKRGKTGDIFKLAHEIGKTGSGGGASSLSSTYNQMASDRDANPIDRYRWLAQGRASGRMNLFVPIGAIH